jgi:hypothetical protein
MDNFEQYVLTDYRRLFVLIWNDSGMDASDCSALQDTLDNMNAKGLI